MANILNVGPIVPVDKGVYSSATTYSILNLVDDGTGQVYLSKKNNNLGNNLTNGEWWGRYTGPQGVKGDTGTINLAGEYGTSESVGLNQKFLTEKMTGFEEVVQTQLITTPPETLNAQVGYYYCIGGNGVVVDTMTIQLPAIADHEESKAKNVSFFMIMGSAPAVTFVSAGAERIRYQKDFALEAERGYEVNALWNSHAWVIAAVEIEIPETRVVATVNVTNTSGTTSILGDTSNIRAVEIDGVEQQSVETGYTFSTTGEHTVKYTLTDPTSIGDDTFIECSALTSVTIPDSVSSIGDDAFDSCSGLTSITIPNTVTSIGDYAFEYCEGLTSVTIPDSVTSIGSNAFEGCSGLTSITIGSGVTSIGDYALNECSDLASIVVDSANTVYDSRDNCNAIIKTSTNELIAGCKNTVIPNTVTSIGNQAFQYCSGLTSITIPDSVATIGNRAFSSCKGLTSIIIPDSVATIGNMAFNYCTGLTSVTIGSGVTTIGQYAFNHCTGLASITIPSSVTSIGNYALNECSDLASIVVDSANTVYDSRDNCNAIIKTSTNELIIGCKNTVIPNTVTNIGDNAFSECSGLTSITIPDSVTSIGNWAFNNCSGLTSVTIPDSVATIGSNAFEGCSGLTSITIGSGVTSIGNMAFLNCSGLTSVTIPDSVTSIGSNAFNNCSGLTSITSLAATAPTISNSTFHVVKTGGTLTVPSGSTGYDVWMGTGNYYLGKYNWTMVEQ